METGAHIFTPAKSEPSPLSMLHSMVCLQGQRNSGSITGKAMEPIPHQLHLPENSKGARSLTATVPTKAFPQPIPVCLIKADPASDTDSDDMSLSDYIPQDEGVDYMPQEDVPVHTKDAPVHTKDAPVHTKDVSHTTPCSSPSAIFINLQPCIFTMHSCNADLALPKPQKITTQTNDPVQEADAKSLGAYVIKESQVDIQKDATRQLSCSLIPVATSELPFPFDSSKPANEMISKTPVQNLTRQPPEVMPNPQEKLTHEIVIISVNNMISDFLENSVDKVIKTALLCKGTTEQESLKCSSALQTKTLPDTELTPDDEQTATLEGSILKQKAFQCNLTTHDQDGISDHHRDTAVCTSYQSTCTSSPDIMEQSASTSPSAAALPPWQTQEVVTMSVQDMTDSPKNIAEDFQSSSTEDVKSTSEEGMSELTSPQCNGTSHFTVTLPLEAASLWQTPENTPTSIQCLSNDSLDIAPNSIALSPTSLVPSQLPLEVQESETMTVKDVSSCSSKVTFAEEKVASLLEFGPAITVPQGSRVLSPGAPCLPWQTHSTRRSFPELALLSTSEASLKQFPEMSFTSATEERVLLDANNNLNCEEPPSAKRLCMSSREAVDRQHVMCHKGLSPIFPGKPPAPIASFQHPHTLHTNNLPLLKYMLESKTPFSNALHNHPNNCAHVDTSFSQFEPPRIKQPHICSPKIPLPQAQPFNSNYLSSGQQTVFSPNNITNSACTVPESPWTQNSPEISTQPCISHFPLDHLSEPHVGTTFPSAANRFVMTPPAMLQSTNTGPVNTPLCRPLIHENLPYFPLPTIHLPNITPSAVPVKSHYNKWNPSASLPPFSNFSRKKSPQMGHQYKCAPISSFNNNQGELVRTPSDVNHLLQYIRPPPPPYQAKPTLPYPGSHTIEYHPRTHQKQGLKPRTATSHAQLKTDGHLHPPPLKVTLQEGETNDDSRQAISPGMHKETSCLNCAEPILSDERSRALKSDVVAVLETVLKLSLPPTVEKPQINLCKRCELAVHRICSGRQMLNRSKERFTRATCADGLLSMQGKYLKKMKDFCVNCDTYLSSKSNRWPFFKGRRDSWTSASVIKSEMSISLAFVTKQKELHLCTTCYDEVKQIKEAQVLMSSAMAEFNKRMVPGSHMYTYTQWFQKIKV